MPPCIPQPPRPLLHCLLPPLQIATACSSGTPMRYAQTHNPPTPTIFRPLCNATRQTLTLIWHCTPHHIHTPQQPLPHSPLHDMPLFPTLALSWSPPMNVMP